MFFCFFISKYIYLVFISGIEQDAKLIDISETSQPYMVFYANL